MTISSAPSIAITASLLGFKVGSLSVSGPTNITAVNPAVTYPSINIVGNTALTFSNGLVSLLGTTVQMAGDGITFQNGVNFNVGQASPSTKS